MSKDNKNLINTNIPLSQVLPFSEIIIFLIGLSKKNKNIKAFWLNGSRAINRQQSDSDLDLVFIVNSTEYKEVLKDELKKYLYYKKFHDYFFDKTFEYWEFNKREVGVHIYSNDEIFLKVKTIFSSLKNFEIEQSFIQHNIINSVSLFDPSDILEHLKTQSVCPKSLSKKQAEISLKRIKQEVEWWHIRKRWRSIFEEMHVIKLLVDEVAKCQYALNNQSYMVALKYYPLDQVKMVPNLSKELNLIMTMNSISDFNAIERTALDSILAKLMKEYKRIYKAGKIII